MKLIRRLWGLNQDTVAAWGEDAEAWMVVEESGELLETFAKHQRGRATTDDVVDEAADQIVTAILAALLAGAVCRDLEDAIRFKAERTSRRLQEDEGRP